MDIESKKKEWLPTHTTTTFSWYTEENLCKLYRVLKWRSLYPHWYETNKYKTVLFEMMKDIETILHKKSSKQLPIN